MTRVFPSLLAALLLSGCADPAPAATPPAFRAASVTTPTPPIAPAAAEAIARAPLSLSLEEGRARLVALDASKVRGEARVELGVGSAPGGILGALGALPRSGEANPFALFAARLRYWRSGPYMVPYVDYQDRYVPFAIGRARPYYVETNGFYEPHFAIWR